MFGTENRAFFLTDQQVQGRGREARGCTNEETGEPIIGCPACYKPGARACGGKVGKQDTSP